VKEELKFISAKLKIPTRRIYKVVTILSFLLTIVLAWAGIQYWSISKIGEEAIPQPADVIIVLGAAVWPQGPSPALQARIDRAVELYNQGYADKIILSGGLGKNPPTEAEAMKVSMLRSGVETSAIHLEKEATNTIENIKYSKEIMEEYGWQSAIIVSDSFHMKRALLIAKNLGVDAYGAPAKNSVLYKNQQLRISYTLREVLALNRYYLLMLFFKP